MQPVPRMDDSEICVGCAPRVHHQLPLSPSQSLNCNVFLCAVATGVVHTAGLLDLLRPTSSTVQPILRTNDSEGFGGSARP